MHVCILLVPLFLSVQVRNGMRREGRGKERNMKAEKVRRKKEKEGKNFSAFFLGNNFRI